MSRNQQPRHKGKTGDSPFADSCRFSRSADSRTIHQKLAAVPQPDALVEAQKRLGITIEPLTPMLAEKYKLAAEDGMFITQVDHGSIRIGIIRGQQVAFGYLQL